MKAKHLVALLSIALMGHPAFAPGQDQKPAEKPTFWIIPHTHWEGAVFKTREEYLQMGLPHILHALDLLRTQPDYTFVLDQVAYVKPFLERYPDQVEDFKRFVKEGRLELVLGLDVMPDVNMPGGETFVRQMLYGKNYYRETFGKDITAAWLIDTFGFHAQMPQILKLGGYTSFWHQRGVNRPTHPSEYLWEGIDGSRIAAFWFPRYYGLMYGSPKELPAFRDFVAQRHASLDPNSHGPHRLALAGVDVCEPEPHLAPMVKAYNEQPDAPLNLKLAVPSQFEKVISHRDDREVFKGELNPIFQGTYSSRIELKSWMRDMEARLTLAEKLAAIARCLDLNVETGDLMQIWELALFNQTHDLASGVMTDHVYDDVTRTYALAKSQADEAVDLLWNAIESRINTSGAGIPLVVFNPLGFARDDLVEIKLDVAKLRAGNLKIVDPAGNDLPLQIIESKLNDARTLEEARIAFVARDVPSLGYSVFRVLPGEAGVTGFATAPDNIMESNLYRVKIDPHTAAVASIITKHDNQEVLAGPGNVVARKTDKGDLWELGRGLDGGSNIAMTGIQPIPRKGDAAFSTDQAGPPGQFLCGPVYSDYENTIPFGTGTITSKIRLIHGVPRIEFTTTLVNKDKYVHYQALFPTPIKNGKNVQEIPFGAMPRPIGIEMPAQNWSAYEDGTRGVALLNHGLPGNFVSEDTLVVSLLRSHNLGAYGFGGGYEPGMSSETGFQIGVPRTLRYALVPYDKSWQSARIEQAGQAFNQPLIARVASAHPGTLPSRWGLLETPNVTLSTLKPGKNNTIILRFYEPHGTEMGTFLIWNAPGARPLASAKSANLIEDFGPAIPLEAGRLNLEFKPFEIKTIALELASPK